MQRALSIFLPAFPLDCAKKRLGRNAPGADEAFALCLLKGGRRLVTAASPAALRAGIRPGLAAADASALVPSLKFFDADEADDARRLMRLARWCVRFAPAVRILAPDALALGIEGVAHLFGGEAAMRRRVGDDLARHGLVAAIAIADTGVAAHALARFGGGPFIAASGKTREAVARLPAAALSDDAKVLAAWARLGLRCVDDLVRLPREGFRDRFGVALAQKLSALLGEDEPASNKIAERLLHEARADFAEPVSTPAQLQEICAHLTDALCRHLERHGLGARRLVLDFFRTDMETQRIRIGLSAPARDMRHMAKLLAMRLESIDPGEGIEAARLWAPMCDPLMTTTPVFAAMAKERSLETAPIALHELVDRLSGRMGEAKVYALAPFASHVPERAVRRVRPFGEKIMRRLRRLPPRPARLLPDPEPVEVIAPVPDDPPVMMRWRRVARRIVRADGPERIAPEWWRDAATGDRVRDYYRIEDEEGRRYWVFRDGAMGGDVPPRWFVHGIFH